MDDGGAVFFALILGFGVGLLLGFTKDSSYETLKEKMAWAETVCKDHGGPDMVDTSILFSAQVTCKNGVDIEDESK